MSKIIRSAAIAVCVSCSGAMASMPESNTPRNVYFGNLHVHTGWSFDGYSQGATTTPDQAYRWA